MEKETIIKALECCTRGRKSNEDIPCFECPYNECNIVGGTSERQTSGTCRGWLMKDALALIKELTEENEKLRKAKVVYETVDYCADDLAKALEENKRLTEENERLKNICNSYALQYGTARDKEVFLKKEREDTVKRFAERLKAICWGGIISPSTIDRIAKEIMEDEKK